MSPESVTGRMISAPLAAEEDDREVRVRKRVVTTSVIGQKIPEAAVVTIPEAVVTIPEAVMTIPEAVVMILEAVVTITTTGAAMEGTVIIVEFLYFVKNICFSFVVFRRFFRIPGCI